jgi:hypothetical protein
VTAASFADGGDKIVTWSVQETLWNRLLNFGEGSMASLLSGEALEEAVETTAKAVLTGISQVQAPFFLSTFFFEINSMLNHFV